MLEMEKEKKTKCTQAQTHSHKRVQLLLDIFLDFKTLFSLIKQSQIDYKIHILAQLIGLHKYNEHTHTHIIFEYIQIATRIAFNEHNNNM